MATMPNLDDKKMDLKTFKSSEVFKAVNDFLKSPIMFSDKKKCGRQITYDVKSLEDAEERSDALNKFLEEKGFTFVTSRVIEVELQFCMLISIPYIKVYFKTESYRK